MRLAGCCLVETGKGIVSWEVFNVYVGDKPQYSFFRCGMNHLKFFPEKRSETFEFKDS